MKKRRGGPRRLNSKSLVWYAQIKLPDGRRKSQSLGTEDWAEALRRWPGAMDKLEAQWLVKLYKPTDLVEVHAFVPPKGDYEWNLDKLGEVSKLVPASSPTAAEYGYRVREEEQEEEEPSPSEGLTWPAVWEHYERRWREKNKYGDPPSNSAYRHFKALLPYLEKSKAPTEIRKKDLEGIWSQIERDRDVKPQTISQWFRQLRAVMDSLYIRGPMPEDWVSPFANFKVTVALTEDRKPYTEAQVRALGAYLLDGSDRHKTALLCLKLLVYTGCRVDEILTREPKHFYIDEKSGVWVMEILPIRDKKTRRLIWKPKYESSNRIIPVPENLAREFVENTKRLPTEKTLNERLKRVIPEDFEGDEICNHRLRNTWKNAQQEANFGMDYQGEAYLGHATRSTESKRYSGSVIPPSQLIEVAQVTWAKLDELLGGA